MTLDTIYNMDCLEGMKQMEDASVDCIITSPPYNFNLRIHYGDYGGMGKTDPNKYGGTFKDALPIQEYFAWQRDCINEMLRISKGLVFYNIQMITGNKLALLQLIGHFADKIKEIIIWDKINAEPAIQEGVLNSQYEFIIVFDKKNAIGRQFDVFNAKRGTEFNVMRIDKNHERNLDGHKAMFPIGLPRKLITLFTNEGDTVLDPFMGSGTTAVACVREKRHFIGFELSEEYHRKAVQRVKNEQSQTRLF